MILLMAGTSEGRELAGYLHQKGFPLLVTTVSEYAASLLEEGIECIHRPLGADDLRGLINQREVHFLIDATHPFAVDASQNAMQAAAMTGVTYLRWDRDDMEEDESIFDSLEEEDSRIIYVQSTEAVLKELQSFERILLTIGSKELPAYASLIRASSKKIYARVLPLPKSLQTCWDLGLPPGQIIACQGPFSLEWNMAMIRQFQIQVLVTKETGRRGGLDAKIQAAVNCGIPVVVMQRPEGEEYRQVKNLADLEKVLKGHCKML